MFEGFLFGWVFLIKNLVSIYLSIYLSISFYAYLYLSMPVCSYLSLHFRIYLSQSVHIYLSIYLSISVCSYLSIYLSLFISIYLSISICSYLSTYPSHHIRGEPNGYLFNSLASAPGPVLDFGPERGPGKGTMADLGPLIRHLVSTRLPSGGRAAFLSPLSPLYGTRPCV